jgi:hypothetical protein
MYNATSGYEGSFESVIRTFPSSSSIHLSLRAEVNELANLYMAARHLNSTKGQTFKNSGRICCMCERPPGELVIVGRFSEATKIEIYTTLTFVVF